MKPQAYYLRYLLPGLLLGIAVAALAQTQTPPNQGNRLPAGDALLKQAVGGTHIPQSAAPEKMVNPYEGDPRAIADGRQYFNAMNCSGCHAAEGGGGMGPPLSDNQWIYGGEPGQIYLTILQGRPNGMPSFAKALPPDAIWRLVSYVSTLSKSPSQPVEKTPAHQQSSHP